MQYYSSNLNFEVLVEFIFTQNQPKRLRSQKEKQAVRNKKKTLCMSNVRTIGQYAFSAIWVAGTLNLILMIIILHLKTDNEPVNPDEG